MNLLDILGTPDTGNAAPLSADERFAAAAVPAEMAAPAGMQDATIPTAPDFPSGVPLPRPRPMAAGAWTARPGVTQDNQASVPDSGAPAQGDGGLLAAITGGSGATSRVRSALAALGAGMTHVKNSPFKAQALANPFGAAIEGGNKDEDRQYQLFTLRLAALDRALRARGITVNPWRAASARRAVASVPAQTSAAAPIGNMQGLVSPSAPAAIPATATASATPAGAAVSAVPEIDLAGQGTQEVPYRPLTLDDYAQIESGSYYLHPDGSVRQKP